MLEKLWDSSRAVTVRPFVLTIPLYSNHRPLALPWCVAGRTFLLEVLLLSATQKSLRAEFDEGPVMDMFWGDRCGTIVDPEGYARMVATHVAEPTPQEMKKGMSVAFAAH